MTPEDLPDVIALAYAESQTPPSIELAAVWWEAVGTYSTDDVKRAVSKYVAGHRWPPKASEIADILAGTSAHRLAQAEARMRQIVASGRTYPGSGPLTLDDFDGDEAMLAAYLEVGQQVWRQPEHVAMRAFAEAYRRAVDARPAIESGSPATLPLIGERIEP